MAIFTIQELTNNNPTTLGTKFEWSDSRSLFDNDPDQANLLQDAGVKRTLGSGYYAAPQGPWENTIKLRTKRTDYPGVSRPSEQVLGANHEPFTLTGMWDDRYNFEGYARKTWRDMESVVTRGNLCRFQYDDIVYHGIITDLQTSYRGAWRIDYTITVSPHYKEIDPGSAQQYAQQTVMTTGDVYDRADQAVANLQQANQDRVDARFTASVLADVDANIQRVDTARTTVALSLDAANLNPLAKPITQWNKFASQFVEMQVAAESVITTTSPLRADLDIISPSAVVMLSFESWQRSLRASARLVRFESIRAIKEMRKRFKPRVARLYRPSEGESIFAVSNRFYGTPTAWRLIAERNRIAYYEFTGDEILVIPERGNS